jgi:hypothetical protein
MDSTAISRKSLNVLIFSQAGRTRCPDVPLAAMPLTSMLETRSRPDFDLIDCGLRSAAHVRGPAAVASTSMDAPPAGPINVIV